MIFFPIQAHLKECLRRPFHENLGVEYIIGEGFLGNYTSYAYLLLVFVPLPCSLKEDQLIMLVLVNLYHCEEDVNLKNKNKNKK